MNNQNNSNSTQPGSTPPETGFAPTSVPQPPLPQDSTVPISSPADIGLNPSSSLPNNWNTPVAPPALPSSDPAAKWADPTVRASLPDANAWPASPAPSSVVDPSLPQNQTTWSPPTQNLSPQTPAPQPNPLDPSPSPDLPSSPSPLNTDTNRAFIPQPAPSPVDAEPANSISNPAPNLSPLDNPWGAPTQSPSIDSASTVVQPSWAAAPPAPALNSNTAIPTPPSESAPTDLSHLISNNNPVFQPAPDSLVVPTGTPETPTLPAENHKGIPVWLIGIGIALLILVAGASAYFILGIGQPSKGTTSLPAVVSTKGAIQTPAPVVTPPTQPPPQTFTPSATASANFGSVQGGSNPAATSAAELLRQRQGR